MAEVVSRRPARRDYKRVAKKDEKRAEGTYAENEVRVTAGRSQRMYISYAINILTGGEDKTKQDSILLSGMGAAVYNAVNIAEIVKRRVKGLHQTTEISSQVLRDEYEALEAGKPNVVHERKVAVITIVLSTKPLDTKHIGYQAPLPDDQVTEQEERPARERGERPERAERGERQRRPASGSRGGRRDERPRGERREGDREGGRPARGERPERTERRDDRPARGDRPARDNNERPRGDRPARDNGDARPPRRDDRPARDNGDARPPRRDDRPAAGTGGRGGYSSTGARGGRGGDRK